MKIMAEEEEEEGANNINEGQDLNSGAGAGKAGDTTTSSTTAAEVLILKENQISHISTNKYFLVNDFEKTKSNNNNNNNDSSSSSSEAKTSTTTTGINIKDYLWKQWQSMIEDLMFIISSSTSNDNDTTTDMIKKQKEDFDQIKNNDFHYYHYKEWFDKIYEHYNDNQRYYHTPVHLYEMFEYLSVAAIMAMAATTTTGLTTTATTTTASTSAYPNTSNNGNNIVEMMKPVLMLAIFFHDVIYDSKSNTNEKDSAELFIQFATDVNNNNNNHQQKQHRLLLSSKVIGQVKTLILATIKHKPILFDSKNNNDEYCDVDIQKVFLDIDMAVLGKTSREAYLSYANAIRKEYIWVDHQSYCTKRSQVLQTFIDNPKIYMSDIFYATLESYARQNLQMEIELLQQGTIPGDE